MNVQGLMNRARTTIGKTVTVETASNDLPRFKWVVIESRLLDGEKILLVTEKKYLKGARKERPDKALYFPPEIRSFSRIKTTRNSSGKRIL